MTETRSEECVPAPVEAAFRAGDVICGRFGIVRLIGRGGMGEVYEAHDLQLDDRVALKTIRSDALANVYTRERFRREIQLARKVTHVNVCRIFDFELHRTESGHEIPFLSMELLAGETLTDLLLRRDRLSTDEALPMIRQIAAGLSAAHQAGVVHRDFKSSNVLLVPQEGGGVRAVVTDFGLARSTNGTGTAAAHSDVSGTPAYMAPEQAEGKESTIATDVYALGIVIYEMVTGALPFSGGSTPSSVARTHLTDEPLRPTACAPDLDPTWERVILRCLERDPALRTASALEVSEALARSPAHLPPAPPARLRPRWMLPVLLAGLVMTIGAAAAVRIFESRRAAPDQAGPLVQSRRSLAVMGFKNLSGRPDAAWMSTAFSEILSSELAATEAVRLVPGENVAKAKMALSLVDAESFAPETLGRIRATLATDLVLLGSYLAVDGSGDGRLRLDVRVQDTATGETVTSFTETARKADVFDLVSQAGAHLRGKLGLRPLTASQAAAASAARPANLEAVRAYAEGLARLRVFDAVGARDLLLKATAADPDYPLAHSALSLAWSQLGYDEKAKEAARRGLDLSQRLSREERLLAQARYAEVTGDRKKALDAYTRLFGLAPDDVEYGLRLGETQVSGGETAEALKTALALEQLTPAADPRVLLLKALAKLEDEPRVAGKLATEGRRRAEAQHLPFVAAQGARLEATVLRQLGDSTAAARAEEFAQAIYTSSGDRVRLADLLLEETRRANTAWELAKAEKLSDEALAIYTEAGNRRGQAAVTGFRATIHRRQGRLTQALRDLDDADRIQQLSEAAGLRLWGSTGRSFWWWARPWVAFEIGDLATARSLYEDILQDSRGELNGDRLPPCVMVLHELGQLDLARRLAEDGLTRMRANTSKPRLTLVLAVLGEVLYSQGELDKAARVFEEAMVYRRRQRGQHSGDPAAGDISLAMVRAEQGRAKEALTLLNPAEERFRAIGAPDYELRALTIRLRALIELDRLDEAHRVARRARTLTATSENLPVRLGAAVELARLRALAEDVPGAARSIRAVVEEAHRRGYFATALQARLAEAEIAAKAHPPAIVADLGALHRDAATHGFHLVEAKTRALLAASQNARSSE
jgi:eukaryotic-like serine/threonine-protein kinase